MRKKNCPLIVNNTNYSIVVFQERGILFNKQVLQPNEAMSVEKFLNVTPFYLNAVIGDESCIPDLKKSLQNLVTVSAIPTAFIVGAFSFAAAAGAMTGPALALAPLANGLVVRGVVIDSAALAAGALLSDRATKVKAISNFIIKKHPESFMVKKGPIFPGEKYFSVTGGVENGELVITETSKDEINKTGVAAIKSPIP